MSATVADFGRKKVKLTCIGMPGSGFLPAESPSAKVADATTADQCDKMVAENLKATSFEMDLDEKTHIVSTLVYHKFGTFFKYLKQRYKRKTMDSIYKENRERFVKILTKLFLCFYDMDDLIRINYDDDLIKQNALFSLELIELVGLENTHKLNATLNAIVREKIDFSKYPLLREEDVPYLVYWYYWLLMRVVNICSVFVPVSSREDIVNPYKCVTDLTFGGGCRDELMEESELEVVRTEVANYKHLEGKKKRAIFEDIDNCTSDMLDVFLTEAVREMKILEMENLLKRFQHRKYFPRFGAYPELPRVVYTVLQLFILSRIKLVEEIRYWVTVPLTSGWIGKFSEDVVKVVSSADLLRRIDSHYFISVHHILQAIREKTVLAAVHKLVSNALLNCSSGRAKSPPYNVYKYSLELANKHGTAEVRVEHLAIAAVCLGVDLCYDVSTEGSAMKYLKSLDGKGSGIVFISFGLVNSCVFYSASFLLLL
ncbi:Glycoside hydrolase, family 5 [Quillaja saponaria]|uniref:Glycoside hydrolase, family 5 n=1 Tax=Quillaja saponaria TaxID=32244 RepID=A0AAD7LM79_QUISA|nr:Glycoside hydrolase, family 5 [Quillaja saponaria]